MLYFYKILGILLREMRPFFRREIFYLLWGLRPRPWAGIGCRDIHGSYIGKLIFGKTLEWIKCRNLRIFLKLLLRIHCQVPTEKYAPWLVTNFHLESYFQVNEELGFILAERDGTTLKYFKGTTPPRSHL